MENEKSNFVEVISADKTTTPDNLVIKFANGLQLGFSEGVSPARLHAIVLRLSEIRL